MSARRLFWASLWFALAVVAIKAHYLRAMAESAGDGLDRVASLAAERRRRERRSGGAAG